MRVQRFQLPSKAGRPLASVLWLCFLTGLCTLMSAAPPGVPKVFAQASQLPSTATGQLGISPEDPVPASQPLIVSAPVAQAASSKTAGSSDEAAGKAALPTIPAPDPNNPVAVQSANLLKMAYSLKTEVDKTTKDMLSVAVVRQAAEIEQTARKMRSK